MSVDSGAERRIDLWTEYLSVTTISSDIIQDGRDSASIENGSDKLRLIFDGSP